MERCVLEEYNFLSSLGYSIFSACNDGSACHGSYQFLVTASERNNQRYEVIKVRNNKDLMYENEKKEQRLGYHLQSFI